VTAPFQEWVEEEVMEAKVTAPFQEEEARVALVGEPLLAAVLPSLPLVEAKALEATVANPVPTFAASPPFLGRSPSVETETLEALEAVEAVEAVVVNPLVTVAASPVPRPSSSLEAEAWETVEAMEATEAMVVNPLVKVAAVSPVPGP